MEDNFFNIDTLLSGDDAAALFEDNTVNNTQETPPDNEQKENEITETVNPEDLFGGESESVGNEDGQVKEDTGSADDSNSPDTSNFYSSMTDALVDEGVFPDLTPEEIKNVKTPEDFRDLILNQINKGLEELLKRVQLALNAGVDTSIIKNYEGTLSFLDLVTPDLLAEESNRGEEIRKKLLQLDFMNKGYSPERATRMTEKIFSSGEDIEEARLALEENKKYFKGKYQEILDNAKNEELQLKAAEKKQRELLEKDILNSPKVFGDLEIDKNTRQKVRDNVLKPVYKDPDTGEYYTAIQKYKKENETDFIKNVGIAYTLTNGFTDFSKLIQPSAKKEVRRKLAELQNTLSNSHRDNGGTLKYVGNTEGQSIFDNGFSIDIN